MPPGDAGGRAASAAAAAAAAAMARCDRDRAGPHPRPLVSGRSGVRTASRETVGIVLIGTVGAATMAGDGLVPEASTTSGSKTGIDGHRREPSARRREPALDRRRDGSGTSGLNRA